MNKYRAAIILLNLILLLAYFNYSVMGKEDLLKDGRLVLLELAPVDPRSLMQGDYMILQYKIAEDIDPYSIPKRGYCVVSLNGEGIANRPRIQEGPTPLNGDEYAIRYALSANNRLNIGAESYFFQEGQAEKYGKAKYGGLTIDRNGNSLLTGLYDENLRKIE